MCFGDVTRLLPDLYGLTLCHEDKSGWRFQFDDSVSKVDDFFHIISYVFDILLTFGEIS